MEERQEKSREQVEVLEVLLEREAIPELRGILSELHPADVAHFLESIPSRERDGVWDLLGPEQLEDVLAYTDDRVRAEQLARMHPDEVASAIEGLDANDAVDLLQDLPEERVDEVLASMDAQHRQRLQAVLAYDEDTAGGLMDVDTLTVRADVSLETVLRYLRVYGSMPDKTDSLIVVDRDNRFQGMLPLVALLTQDPKSRVESFMVDEAGGIPASTPSGEVARLFEQRDLISAPVVDAEGVLLGRITIDDVVDVIREEGEHTVMRMAGLDEEDDIFAPVLTSARRRNIWLGVNLGTALLASWVIGLFEATLREVVALAILMPIVASMGGIAGSQTLTIVIRGMAVGHVGSSNAQRVMVKEILVGLMNGLLWALVVALIAGLWFRDTSLGLIIGVAMIVNLIVAALSGASIPLLLKRLNIDPALAGGVVLTTVTDVIGFMVFLGLGTAFLLS